MPSTLIRLAVALLTFGLGVSATMFWIAYRTPDANRRSDFYIKTVTSHPHWLPSAPPLHELPPPPPLPLAPISGGNLTDQAISLPQPALTVGTR
ncbi:MAG TPA: hypothetical protein VGB05_03380, partial [Pyrinomonadaceae bacterium]